MLSLQQISIAEKIGPPAAAPPTPTKSADRMNYSILDFISLLGSVCLFLYGMKVMSEGLQKVAGISQAYGCATFSA